ncbi:hypothetical protein GGI01_002794 [Coemansia sp. RSA 376]|nr:hypothetical protein GGI01_002794 [Coemansia sp. RSA 376]
MACINDLPNNVLRLILYYAGATLEKTLYEWKAKLPLIAVCRTWTKLAQDFVFHQVYVEFDTPHSNTRHSWTSNAGFLISRGCILKAERLTIELVDRITPECLQTIALEILQLDRVDWQRINALTVTTPFIVFPGDKYNPHTDEASDTDIAWAMQYFARNLRNVAKLKLGHYKSGSRGNYICSSLATLYGRQLQVYRASKYITFSFTSFSRTIKVLELTLDSTAARILPSICGETLEDLKLYDVPRNFAWHHFRYDTFDQPIVFHQLTTLHLYFDTSGTDLTESEIQDKVVSGTYCCDQLSFPALKQLSIANCTPDCDLLYADLPFPELKYVRLTGSIASIRHCSRLKLTWVRDFHVTVGPCKLDNATDIYQVTNHFFTDIFIGRTASFSTAVDWFTLDPELMRWANLTILEVDKADYATACKTVGRLPNLCELTIRKLVMSSYIEDSSLFTSADPLLAWGEKLAILYIYFFEGDCPLADCVGSIQDLILHAGINNALNWSAASSNGTCTQKNSWCRTNARDSNLRGFVIDALFGLLPVALREWAWYPQSYPQTEWRNCPRCHTEVETQAHFFARTTSHQILGPGGAAVEPEEAGPSATAAGVIVPRPDRWTLVRPLRPHEGTEFGNGEENNTENSEDEEEEPQRRNGPVAKWVVQVAKERAASILIPQAWQAGTANAIAHKMNQFGEKGRDWMSRKVADAKELKSVRRWQRVLRKIDIRKRWEYEYEERWLSRNNAQICKEEASAVRPKKRRQLMRKPHPPDVERDDGTPAYPRESAAQKWPAYSLLCTSLIDDWCRGRKSKVEGKGLWSINP